MIVNSGPLKAVDPIPAQTSKSDIKPADKTHIPRHNNDSNESNNSNATNETNEQITNVNIMEDDLHRTENVSKSNTPEVFGSLVSLNDYAPNPNRDQ